MRVPEFASGNTPDEFHLHSRLYGAIPGNPVPGRSILAVIVKLGVVEEHIVIGTKELIAHSGLARKLSITHPS